MNVDLMHRIVFKKGCTTSTTVAVAPWWNPFHGWLDTIEKEGMRCKLLSVDVPITFLTFK